MTEINYGRYFTTSNFFANIGVNTPYEEYLYVVSGEKPEKRIDQVKDEMYWIRGLDHEPVLMETLPYDFS
jgi:carbamoyl-phosphate synthase large subunit